MSITFVTAGYRMNAGIRPTTCLIDVTESLDILQESLGDPCSGLQFYGNRHGDKDHHLQDREDGPVTANPSASDLKASSHGLGVEDVE